jgi:hypothetical protein
MRAASLAICLCLHGSILVQADGQQRVPRVDDVVSGLQAREQSIQSLDVVVKFTEAPGPEYHEYFESQEEYERAFARFYDLKRAPQVPKNRTHTIPSPAQFSRYRRNAQGEARYDWLAGPLIPGATRITGSECSRGRYWEQFWPNGDARVFVREAAWHPRSLAAIGLEAAELKAFNPRLFSDLVREADGDGRLLDIRRRTKGDREFVEVVLVVPGERGSLAQVYDRLTISLDPSRGWAPVEMESVWTLEQEEEYVVAPVPRSSRQEWQKLYEAAPGLWLARGLTIHHFGSVLLPQPGRQFVPRIVDGQPVLIKGESVPEIDWTQGVITRYHCATYRYTVEQVEVNQVVEGPLCPAAYQAGTIVQNYVTGEMYRLTQPGPAIDPPHKEDLGPLAPES